MGNVVGLNDIPKQFLLRYPLDTITELNWQYGFSKEAYPGKRLSIGLPVGKISLWAGEAGVGKSRATIEVAKCFSKKWRVLYFTNEMSLGSFADFVKGRNDYVSGKFFIS